MAFRKMSNFVLNSVSDKYTTTSLGAAMARVFNQLPELKGCDRNRSLPELDSHWKAIDEVDSVALRWAAEVPQGETRRGMNRLARSFTDIDFMRMLNSALVEDPVSFSNNSFTHAETFIYKYTRSKLYTVQDEEHKSFVLWRHTGQAQLMAVHLQGPNSSEAVKLNLDLYRSPHISPKRISPVAMNIVESNASENNLYLCCVKDKAVLQLEKVKGPMKDIRTEDQKRFIFFKTISGSTCSFESAAHPGWFLSTSKLNDKPVRMVNQTGERAITDFHFIEI
ncbi:interleukin-1 receptor antagonist protein-like [Trachemys scripta elegans]|uniref:interleukin-1 receptor antagonist protein-like n=1 Tax=Trachemys scripta elegans TaxID=31138 RepID=UPI001551E635|nr:interleukin-1 receptor antagonist protein-like [Trachemys scripta elegans]